MLDDEQVQAARKEDVLNALSQIASKFRTRVGESLATVQKYYTPLAEATTPSLEALKAYSMGRKVQVTGHAAALPFFKRAIGTRSQIASAYAWLGRMYLPGFGEARLSAEATGKAREWRDRASEQEKFFIDFSYYRLVTGDVEKAHQTCELWARSYPRDMYPRGFLGSSASTTLGKFEKAIGECKKAIDLDPDHSFTYANLAHDYIFLDRLAEAESTLQRAIDRKLELPDFPALQYEIAFLKNDRVRMERLAAQLQEKFETYDWISDPPAFCPGILRPFAGGTKDVATCG